MRLTERLECPVLLRGQPPCLLTSRRQTAGVDFGLPGYGVAVNSEYSQQSATIPPLVLQPVAAKLKPKFWGDGGPIGPDLGVIDPAPMQRFVTEDAYIRQGIGTTGSVMYGDKQIGPSGALSNGRAEI